MRSLKGVFGIERLLSSAVSEVMAGYGVLMGAMTRDGGVDGGAIATTPASFSHQHPRRESVALLCPQSRNWAMISGAGLGLTNGFWNLSDHREHTSSLKLDVESTPTTV